MNIELIMKTVGEISGFRKLYSALLKHPVPVYYNYYVDTG